MEVSSFAMSVNILILALTSLCLFSGVKFPHEKKRFQRFDKTTNSFLFVQVPLKHWKRNFCFIHEKKIIHGQVLRSWIGLDGADLMLLHRKPIEKKITFIIPELYYQYQDSNPMILILMKLHFHPSNFPQNLFWAFSAKPLYEFKFIPQNFKLKIKKTTKWFIRTTENLNHSHLIWNSSSFIIRMMGNFFYKLPGMLSHHRTRGKAWERCFLVLSFYSLP